MEADKNKTSEAVDSVLASSGSPAACVAKRLRSARGVWVPGASHSGPVRGKKRAWNKNSFDEESYYYCDFQQI